MSIRKKCVLVFAWFCLCYPGISVSAGDMTNGKALHDENCLRCHQPDLYTREKRMVNSYTELHEQVRQCELMAELAWFDEEIEDVVYYLNESFYHFEPVK